MILNRSRGERASQGPYDCAATEGRLREGDLVGKSDGLLFEGAPGHRPTGLIRRLPTFRVRFPQGPCKREEVDLRLSLHWNPCVLYIAIAQ